MSLNFEFASEAELRDEAMASIPEPRKPSAPKRSEDPRFWKPTVNNAAKEYKALLRVLPRQRDGRGGYCVPQHVHYIKENVGGKDIYLSVKCRKTLGKDEFCPICDANKKMYNTKQEALMEKAKGRSASVTYIGNFLILRDLVRPELDGNIKLWEHRKYMNDMIMAPMTKGVELVKAQSFDAKPVLQNFYPYHPTLGHNLVVHMNVNPKNNIPSYENSYWESQASAFTDNQDTLDYVFGNLFDLSEFMDDVPSVDEINKRFLDFNERVAAAGSDPGIQSGFVPGYAPQGMPTAGFAPQAPVIPQNAHPGLAAVAQSQMGASVSIPGFNASAPVAVPGFNTAGFQKPAVVGGDSNAYFGGAPTQGIQLNTAAQTAMEESAGDDLPF